MRIDDKPGDEFILVPVGYHPARVIKIERNRTKGSADKPPHDVFNVTFKTLDAPGFVNDGLHLTDASIKRFKNLYYAVGGGPSFDTDNLEEVKTALIGRTLMLAVKHDEYVAKDGTPKVKAVPQPWDGFIRLTAEEKAKYPDGAASVEPEPGETTGASSNSDDPDDDLPF